MNNQVFERVEEGDHSRLLFYCPGCKMHHGPVIGGGIGPRWEWNGDLVKPVLSPSILVTWDSMSKDGRGRCHTYYVRHGRYPTHKEEPQDVHNRCHSFIGINGAQPGQIIYLGDCTHELAGTVLDLPAVDDESPVAGKTAGGGVAGQARGLHAAG